MKKAILLLMAAVLLFAVSAFATSAQPSGDLTSSGVVVTGHHRLVDCGVFTDGTHQVTAVFYDNASAASGTVLYRVVVPGAALSGGCTIPFPVVVQNGIYLSLTGTGGTVDVYYDPYQGQ